MIQANSLANCQRQLETCLSNYFDRLVSIGAPNAAIRIIRPKIHIPDARYPQRMIIDFQSTPSGATPLVELREHIRLATSEEVLSTIEHRWTNACRGLYIVREQSRTIITGSESIEIIQNATGQYVIRTNSYRYHLLTNGRPRQPAHPFWYGLRMESDSFIGGWMLNHPLHHFQTGLDEELRIRAAQDHSLTGFIDWCLRNFSEGLWSQIYPEFHGVLKSGPLRAGHYGTVASRIRQNIDQLGRGSLHPKWYEEWEQWRKDIAFGAKIDDFIDSLAV